ncbi:MAG: beta-phosphoglucomutase [Nitriliruptoraceae bacterium]
MPTAVQRAVIFDLDGVLTETAEYHYLGWQRLADEEGLAFDREANEALRGLSRGESLKALLGDREVDAATFDAMMERKNGYYVDSLQDMSPKDLLPGAISLVTDAKRRGMKVAIGSSSKNARFVLDKLQITDLFDAIADGHTVERAKPAPDLFLAAADLLGVDPAHCIVIEDAGAGIDAALAAGMTAVGTGPEERVGHGHVRFDATRDVDLTRVCPPDEHQIGGAVLLADGWVVIDDHHDPEQVINLATSHLTGNGYLGYRGTLPEWRADATVGCTVSDTWDNADGKWAELCNVPNALYARIDHLGRPIAVDADSVLSDRDLLERRLDVRYGRQHRIYGPSSGPVQRLVDERFASMDQRHLLAQRQRVFATPGTRLTVTTGIDGDVWSLNGDHFASVEVDVHDDALLQRLTTTERGLAIAVGHAISIHGGSVQGQRVSERGREVVRTLDVEVGPDGLLVLDQVMTVHSGNDVDDPASASLELARKAAADGYEILLARHALAWERLWARADVTIEGDPVAQAVLRYNLYHNIIATPMHAEHLPVGARGLSCQAYQGAAFWDQEVFNLPMWVHTFPEVARNLLVYRHGTLDGARRKAARLGYQGAFYAWISGDTGDELCPDFFFEDVLTGRPIRNHFNDWQMHISPDIAVTIDGFIRATGDETFVQDRGAELVFEVARFLTSFVHFRPADGRYHLLRLLGPDEYHENVDDNVFSLEQSRVALAEACRLHDLLQADHREAFDRLVAALGLTREERDLWQDIHDRLVVIEPDPHTHVLEQFDGYFDLEDIAPDDLRERLQHPDEYWGWPNGIAVHTQVTKQPDVVQLFVTQPERYDTPTVEANYDYYLPRTQHGSSLSRPMYALVAARLGRVAEAEQLFRRSATVDLLADSHPAPGGTFIGGIHVAACGAAWQVVVLGFGGVHIRDGYIEVNPRLPEAWDRLCFGIAFRGCWVEVAATDTEVALHAPEDNPHALTVEVHGERVEVAPGGTRTVALSGTLTR